VARQEHHRHVNAVLTQSGQQVDARNTRQPPIEDDDVSIAGGIERPHQRVAVGKAAHGKSMPRQFVTDDLAVVVIVFDEKHTDGIRFLVRRICGFKNFGPRHGGGCHVTGPILLHRSSK
jgi:hypothetical protein